MRKYGMETARYGMVDTTCLEVTCAAPCRDIDACIQIREVNAALVVRILRSTVVQMIDVVRLILQQSH
jgi:hypothetical protein